MSAHPLDEVADVARAEQNRFARLIANYLCGGLDVPAELVDAYRAQRIMHRDAIQARSLEISIADFQTLEGRSA